MGNDLWKFRHSYLAEGGKSASRADSSQAEHRADARSVEMEVDPPASSLSSGNAASSCTRTTANFVPRPARVDRTV